MIGIKNLTYRIGSRILFDHATLQFPIHAKIGVVGPNGCGKTTLFRIILGKEEIDSGEISIKNGINLVCVKQEIEDGNIGLLDFVVNADAKLIELQNLLTDDTLSVDEIAHVYDQLAIIDGYSATARASEILSGLGFKQSDLGKKISEFSGGWQVRASLAATLFAPSDCLLLDEPTNHLDLGTAIWLENYLANTSKMVVMISHEKQFLNKVCNYIVSIHDKHLQLYKGNYDTYIDTREKQKLALTKTVATQQKRREHIQSFIDRFRAKATKAKQAQSRMKMLEKMEILELPSSDYTVKLSFPKSFPAVDRILIDLANVTAGYEENIVLRHVNMTINFGDRIALLGANGNGKSTLAKLISNRLQAMSGKVTFGRNVKLSYFSQQQADELNIMQSPIEALKSAGLGFSDFQARAHLARFGITQSRAETLIKNLSGGEKSRVLLSLNSIHSPHVMIFDEPTNHLDIEAREALVDAIKQYDGAVILITHDFFTLSHTCDKFFVVDGGKCTLFNGTLDDYRKLLLSTSKDSQSNFFLEKQNESSKKINNKKSAISNTSKIIDPKRMEVLEKTISDMESRKADIERQLSDGYTPELYKSYNECCSKLEDLENEWLKNFA